MIEYHPLPFDGVFVAASKKRSYIKLPLPGLPPDILSFLVCDYYILSRRLFQVPFVILFKNYEKTIDTALYRCYHYSVLFIIVHKIVCEVCKGEYEFVLC